MRREVLGGDAGFAAGMWPWHVRQHVLLAGCGPVLSPCTLFTVKVLLGVVLFLGTLSEPPPQTLWAVQAYLPGIFPMRFSGLSRCRPQPGARQHCPGSIGVSPIVPPL